MGSIIRLAQQGGPQWEAFATACNQLGDGGDMVDILDVGKWTLHEATGQYVRLHYGYVRHPSGLIAEVGYHVGLGPDMIYTGYFELEFRDWYEVTVPGLGTYRSPLWQADNRAGPVYQGWYAVAPIRMAFRWAITARSLWDQSIRGKPTKTLPPR